MKKAIASHIFDVVFFQYRMSEYDIELLKLQKKRIKLQEEHPHLHFSEIQDMRVQAIINRTVPDSHPLGGQQLLGVQAVTNQAVLQSPQLPGRPECHDAMGETQLLGVQAVTHQAVLQSP